jgi:threonine 3-dehydrogenase
MRAWRKTHPAPGAERVEIPVPQPGPGEVLLKVRRVSVCGTDLHIYRWDRWAQRRIRTPLIFGHEFVAEVVGAGDSAGGLHAGQLVAVESHVACGRCHPCRIGEAHVCENVEIVGLDRDGAFAEFVAVPAQNAWPVPAAMPLEQAAALEPLGNAVHTVLAGEVAGAATGITGCGPLGLFAICVARACGAGPIVASDMNAYRLELARACGADRTVNVREEDWEVAAREATGGRGLDLVCEMSGQAEAVRGALKSLRNGGRLALLGLSSEEVSLDLSGLVIFKGITVQGILGRRLYRTWDQMTSLLGSGRLDISRAITHRMPIDRLEEAMEILASGQAGKIVLVPWGETESAPRTGRAEEAVSSEARVL